ncbi:MAG: hypothetical protein HY651_03775 [Acidobacteria bacterium]|nr:hypothetical protein [Acidobacteriota bacterium]
MPELLLHQKRVESIFHLLGEHENDMTYSVAWALAQSPSFLRVFLKSTVHIATDGESVVIRLQQHEKNGGITDIEIEDRGRFFIIAEAKRGWTVPTLKQLVTYAKRRSFAKSKQAMRRILVLSGCSHEYALLKLEARKVDGIEIHPVSWNEVAESARVALRGSSHAEKRLLRELLTYLQGVITMQNTDSNWVYVVSLGSGSPEGWGISWIDIVKKKSRYFHPVGATWPKEPPNYIAFRYHGMLQSIHHIESWEIFTNFHNKFSEAPEGDGKPRFLYKLGPAFGPQKEVKAGKIRWNRRVECMLDTLFTCDTISEAVDISKRRESKDG